MKILRFNEDFEWKIISPGDISNCSRYFETLVGFEIAYFWDTPKNKSTVVYMCRFIDENKLNKLKETLNNENIKYEFIEPYNINFTIPIYKVIEYSQLWLDIKNFNL